MRDFDFYQIQAASNFGMQPPTITSLRQEAASHSIPHNISGSIQGKFCSPKNRPLLLAQILPGFKSKQKILTEQIGLGFLSDAPLKYDPNRVLSAWLLSSINYDRSTICIEPGIEIPIGANEALSVLGLPSGNLPVTRSVHASQKLDTKNLAKAMSIGYAKSSNRLARARAVLLSLHSVEQLSEPEERAFTISLIMYTVSTFLAPVSNPASMPALPPTVMLALSDRKYKGALDWAGFTVERLMSASKSLQEQLRQDTGTSTIYLDGCLPLLNVST